MGEGVEITAAEAAVDSAPLFLSIRPLFALCPFGIGRTTGLHRVWVGDHSTLPQRSDR